MGLTVVIPSAGRAERVLADRAIVADAIVVPESEAAAYAAGRYRAPIVTHPDHVRGLARKRQWIADRYGDVFMVDDDVKVFRRLWLPTYRRDYRMTAEEARAAAEATYETAREMGAYLFGFAFFGDPRLFRPDRPFLLTGYVNGACFGLRAGSKLRFDPDVVAVEDLALSGTNAFHHRYLFIDQRFGPQQAATFANAGGQAMHRTAETEVRDTDLLRRLFGDAVQRKKVNHKVGKRNHHTPAQRQLVIPF